VAASAIRETRPGEADVVVVVVITRFLINRYVPM